MELPTYTNIWKIEKRLYKLYDFRLPMPLPVGQVAAFLAIAVPYTLILTMAGMPFSHTWLWLYVLPPGVLAWLVTRPVLEGKRLPELALSQLRYLTEPRTWCRMAPLAERDQQFVSATVWRRPTQARRAEVLPAADPDMAVAATTAPTGTAAPAATATSAATAEPDLAGIQSPVWPGRPATGTRVRATSTPRPARQPEPAWPRPAHPEPTRAQPARPESARPEPARPESVRPEPGWPDVVQAQPDRPQPVRPEAARAETARAEAAPTEARPAAPDPAEPGGTAPRWPMPDQRDQQRPRARPAITVRTDAISAAQLNVVERALRTPRSDGWHERVVVVPGGHRPGKPDQVQRDQARARLPLADPARIVLLGCTGGAGQTMITLLAGQLLASLRDEPVAVLDLGVGPGSLTERAREIPRLLPNRRGAASAASDHGEMQPMTSRERGLQVVTADHQADEAENAGRLIDAVVARYQLTLADPSAAHVPRALRVADQLVLVAPASADAAGSLAMTLEWLEAHGHEELVSAAIAVLNGVSDRTGKHVDKAATVAAGRCRAVIRVPWDGGLAGSGPLGAPTVRAVTALAGVLIAGLAQPAGPIRAGATPAGATPVGPAPAGPGRAER